MNLVKCGIASDNFKKFNEKKNSHKIDLVRGIIKLLIILS